MKKTNFPADHQQVMPYIVVKETEAFMNFMQMVFDAREKMIYKTDPYTIAHGEMSIGKSVLMFSGDTSHLAAAACSAFVYVDDADEVYRKALHAGATSVMEIKDSPYGRSGGFMDPFGNTWWIKAYRDEE